MPKAGYCGECKKNVWIKEDGSCQFGHPASAIAYTYDTETEQTVFSASQSLTPDQRKIYEEERIRLMARNELIGNRHATIGVTLGVIGLIIGNIILGPISFGFGLSAWNKGVRRGQTAMILGILCIVEFFVLCYILTPGLWKM